MTILTRLKSRYLSAGANVRLRPCVVVPLTRHVILSQKFWNHNKKNICSSCMMHYKCILFETYLCFRSREHYFESSKRKLFFIVVRLDTLTGDEASTSLTVIKDGNGRKLLRTGSGSRAGCYTDPHGCWYRIVGAGSGSNNHHTPAAIRQAANTGSWCS